MKIDFSACANFKGNNQKPLWLAEARGALRPNIKRIAERAIRADLDAVVLRSYSHPGGTDNRWKVYETQARNELGFSILPQGMIIYTPKERISRPLRFIHGQGLMTSAGNIQILFIDNQIGTRGEKYNSDFDSLVFQARCQGNDVMIIAQRPHKWNPKDLEKVDVVEVWNGMDTEEDNIDAQETAIQLDKPGVIVSNSKTLCDLGRSYTALDGISKSVDRATSRSAFYNLVSFCTVVDGQFCGEGIAQQIKRKVFLNHPEGRRRTSHLSRLVQALAIAEVKLTGNKS